MVITKKELFTFEDRPSLQVYKINCTHINAWSGRSEPIISCFIFLIEFAILFNTSHKSYNITSHQVSLNVQMCINV